MDQQFSYIKEMTMKEGYNIFKEYEVIAKIGVGNSIVYSVKKSGDSLEKAMKEMQINNENDYQCFRQELELMQKICKGQHPNIVQFYDYCLLERESEYQNLRLAYILLEKGLTSLESLIINHKRKKQHFDIITVKLFMQKSINVHKYLQEQKIAHCDIKPDNILIMNPDTLEFKVCDIGSGKIVGGDNTQTSTINGTIPFLSPELLQALGNHFLKHNAFKSDVFSLGLCFIYLLTFKKFSMDQRQFLNDERFKDVIEEWIQEAITLYKKDREIQLTLTQMLIIDHKNRPDFIQLEDMLSKTFQTLSPEKYQNLSPLQNCIGKDLSSSQICVTPLIPAKECVVESKKVKTYYPPSKQSIQPLRQNSGTSQDFYTQKLKIQEPINKPFNQYASGNSGQEVKRQKQQDQSNFSGDNQNSQQIRRQQYKNNYNQYLSSKQEFMSPKSKLPPIPISRQNNIGSPTREFFKSMAVTDKKKVENSSKQIQSPQANFNKKLIEKASKEIRSPQLSYNKKSVGTPILQICSPQPTSDKELIQNPSKEIFSRQLTQSTFFVDSPQLNEKQKQLTQQNNSSRKVSSNEPLSEMVKRKNNQSFQNLPLQQKFQHTQRKVHVPKVNSHTKLSVGDVKSNYSTIGSFHDNTPVKQGRSSSLQGKQLQYFKVWNQSSDESQSPTSQQTDKWKNIICQLKYNDMDSWKSFLFDLPRYGVLKELCILINSEKHFQKENMLLEIFQQIKNLKELNSFELIVENAEFSVPQKYIMNNLTLKTLNISLIRCIQGSNDKQDILHLLESLLGPSVQNLSLKLSFTDFKHLLQLSQILPTISNLKFIELTFHSINFEVEQQQQHKIIYESLRYLKNLQTQRIGFQSCQSNFKQTFIQFNQDLTSLCMNYDHTQMDFSINSLVAGLQNLKGLQNLEVSFNHQKITESNLNFFFKQIEDNLKNLIKFKLQLSDIQTINDYSIKNLFERIVNLKQLEQFSIYLQDNNITQEIIKIFLRYLDRSNGSALGQFEYIGPRVSCYKNLKHSTYQMHVRSIDVQNYHIIYLDHQKQKIPQSQKVACCQSENEQYYYCLDCTTLPYLQVEICSSCILNCHKGHTYSQTTLTTTQGLYTKTMKCWCMSDKCCTGKKQNCSSVFGKQRQAPIICLTCSSTQYICQFCANFHHWEHIIKRLDFDMEFMCGQRFEN